MQELTTEKTMTTKEVAEVLGIAPHTVTETAKKCLPNKVIQNGKPTYWNEKELTVLLDYKRQHISNNAGNLSVERIGTTKTALSGQYNFEKACNTMIENIDSVKALDFINAMQAVTTAYIQKLQKENADLKRNLDESEEWCSLLKYCAEHDMNTDLKVLRSLACNIKKAMALQGLKPVKIPDSRYPNGINSYPREFLDRYFASGEF